MFGVTGVAGMKQTHVQLELHLPDKSPGKVYTLPGQGLATQLRFVLHTGSPALSADASLWIDDEQQLRFTPRDQDAVCCEALFELPGVYHIAVKNAAAKDRKVFHECTLLVPPELTIKGEHVPLRAIAAITVVPKWLGTVDTWMDKFEVIARSGFNMVHFAPLQQRGQSNSPYSIADQLAYSDDLIPRETDQMSRDQLVHGTIDKLEQQLGLLSMTDVVWNHTAHSSAWLAEHPEAGYNLTHCPHLKAAFALDEAIMAFSISLPIVNPNLCSIKHESDVSDLVRFFEQKCLLQVRLWEYMTIDVAAAITELGQKLKLRQANAVAPDSLDLASKIKLLEESIYTDPARPGERYSTKINTTYLQSLFDAHLSDNEIIAQATQLLDALNVEPYRRYDDLLRRILANVSNRLRYERLDKDGPQKGPISGQQPLVDTYFTRLPVPPGGVREDYVVVNNGWIYNADPMVDFASEKSDAYLARDVIVWGDCVKLRYGQTPEDNPWLWQHMTAYTEKMAKHFHAFRIDNCHSTPLHVGQYLMLKARCVRPNIYVMAELFSGSEEKDNMFVAALGLNALVRESLAAWNASELSRIFYRVGTVPIGSFHIQATELPPAKLLEPHHARGVVTRLTPGRPDALFMDCSHDNQIPKDLSAVLPITALCAFLPCAIGSVRGWDELYPKHLNVVHESRLYQSVDPSTLRNSASQIGIELDNSLPLTSPVAADVVVNNGIFAARTLLLALHRHMATHGFIETFVSEENNIVSIHRVRPDTQTGYIVLAHTVFGDSANRTFPNVSPAVLCGQDVDFVCCAQLSVANPEAFTHTDTDSVLRGIQANLFFTTVASSASPYFDIALSSEETKIYVRKFPPGSILVFRTRLRTEQQRRYDNLRRQLGLGGIMFQLRAEDLPSMDDIHTCVSTLTLVELNILLYRSDGEERSSTKNEFGEYMVPNFGGLGYCGLQGIWSCLHPIIESNNMGHPLLQHLRQGLWLLDYTVNRLDCYRRNGFDSEGLYNMRQWLSAKFALIKNLAKPLQLRSFAIVMTTAYEALCHRAVALMGQFVHSGGIFVRNLALTTVQLYGTVPSASLVPFKSEPTLAAGLPFFATDHMRCWGRDTFIALRGLFLCTGRYAEARHLILRFAGCVRHGLIPNLVDSGRCPRFNCRDAAFWWLQAIQDYASMAPEGIDILDAQVDRLFLTDDSPVPTSLAECTQQPLSEIVQEVLQRHANGIDFYERNAGPSIDSKMSAEGFHVTASIDWSVHKTGFVMGGNEHNCGTWMDKMGESELAGTKGVPATPRDGAAVEMVGLLKSAVRWLSNLNAKGLFPYSVVTMGNDSSISYAKWNDMIQDNFESHFYIPLDGALDEKYHVLSAITRRGIYRDTWASHSPTKDTQFRPNFLVAMVVAPELFEPEHAKNALIQVEKMLVGPLGIKTLDPNDWSYRGVYNNDDSSFDGAVAKGFNYHQGPEWLWLMGYYLRAGQKFLPQTFTKQYVLEKLQRHRHKIVQSAWAGLPELTNAGGQECSFSCPTQAWSSSTLLDALFDTASSS